MQLGVKSIMNLERGLIYEEPEYVRRERLIAEELGLRFLHIPLHPIKSPTIAEVKKALGLLIRHDNHPIFVHCERGNDRTGIVIAAFRIKVEGWDFDKAIDEMKSFGHRSKLLFWWTNVLVLIKNHDHKEE